MKKQKIKALATATADIEGDRTPLVVRRGGNATTRDVLVRLEPQGVGTVRLEWRADGDSKPLLLPPGTYTLVFFVLGKTQQTYAFELRQPKVKPLGYGKLTSLGAESYDRTVTMP